MNYFQLYWDGSRWWIAGMVWDLERPGAPIPEAWVGKFEEVPADSGFAAMQERGLVPHPRFEHAQRVPR